MCSNAGRLTCVRTACVCTRYACTARGGRAVLPDCSAHAGAWAPQSMWGDSGGRVSERLRTVHTLAAEASGALRAPGLQILSVSPVAHCPVPVAVTVSFPLVRWGFVVLLPRCVKLICVARETLQT